MLQKQSPQAYEKALCYVQDKILAKEYRLGDRLPSVEELSNTLSVHPNSVREALRTMQMLGVIDGSHGKECYISGNFEKNLITSLSMMFILQNLDYSQVSQLRVCLELKACELACAYRSDSHLKELHSIIRELRSSQDEEYNAMLDAKFHYTIALISQNKLIIDILQALSSITHTFIYDMQGYILSRGKYKKQLQLSHEQIVQGIEQRNFPMAEQALKEHFRIIDEEIFQLPHK